MPEFIVKSTTPKGHRKQLSLADERGHSLMAFVPRFACVKKGDKVHVHASRPEVIHCISEEDEADHIKISPHFHTEGLVSVGALSFPIRLTEVNAPEDIESLSFLEQFHYKSVVTDPEEPSEDQENLFNVQTIRPKTVSQGGRKVVLVAYIKTFGTWQPAGYIELQMPLMMCKPRHELFARPFEHSSRPVAWDQWDQHAIRKYVNTIVRIARVVVHPEYRGLGIARDLIKGAKDYCRSRWQIAGKRPLFIEISAQMLNYIDFVSNSGFEYIGKTEGNLDRLTKDLASMAKGYAVSSGIMSLQKRYLTAVETYCRETRISFEDVVARLNDVVRLPEPMEHLNSAEWAAFRKVLRQPIPYFIAGLDDDTQSYIRAGLADGDARPAAKPRFRVKAAQVELKNLSVMSAVPLPQTRNVRLIMEAFGLSGDTVESQVVAPIDIRASAGNIVLIVGASGAGKSALLKGIASHHGHPSGLSVRSQGSRDYSCGWLKALPNDVAIFDYFAERYSAEQAFAALSQVGLAEAFVLVKPFAVLSRGQQYRAMLADLLLRKDQVWLLDEFCADLDPVTARIVAHNFRRQVYASSRIAFVAAANHGHYLDALRPTRVIQLKAGAAPAYLSSREYRDGLLQQIQ